MEDEGKTESKVERNEEIDSENDHKFEENAKNDSQKTKRPRTEKQKEALKKMQLNKKTQKKQKNVVKEETLDIQKQMFSSFLDEIKEERALYAKELSKWVKEQQEPEITSKKMAENDRLLQMSVSESKKLKKNVCFDETEFIYL